MTAAQCVAVMFCQCHCRQFFICQVYRNHQNKEILVWFLISKWIEIEKKSNLKLTLVLVFSSKRFFASVLIPTPSRFQCFVKHQNVKRITNSMTEKTVSIVFKSTLSLSIILGEISPQSMKFFLAMFIWMGWESFSFANHRLFQFNQFY